MKFRLTTPNLNVYATLLGAAVLLLSFQNCGKAGFDSGLDDGLSQASVDPDLEAQFGKSDAEKVAAIPFAYDTIVDQIAYNSCTGSALQSTPGFFTFKVGGYSAAGGVKLRQEFFNYLEANNLKPVYPAENLSALQIKNFLAASPENRGAQPQFAIRARGNPQSILALSGSTPTRNLDYQDLLGDLTDDRYMDPLVSSSISSKETGLSIMPTQYFPLAVSSLDRSIEAQISFNLHEADAVNLRSKFSGVQLAMTYTSNVTGDPYVARFPVDATETSQVYGRGYNITFARGTAPFTRHAHYYAGRGDCGGNCFPEVNNPSNVMASVQEVNLENSAVGTGASWTCDPSRRYVIVKSTDAAGCPKEPFAYLGGIGASATTPALTYLEYRRELEIVRRSLRSEDWDVNIQLRCAVPKARNETCYPLGEKINGVTVGVQYDQMVECFSSGNKVYSGGGGNPARCAEYVSICTRN